MNYCALCVTNCLVTTHTHACTHTHTHSGETYLVRDVDELYRFIRSVCEGEFNGDHLRREYRDSPRESVRDSQTSPGDPVQELHASRACSTAAAHQLDNM